MKEIDKRKAKLEKLGGFRILKRQTERTQTQNRRFRVDQKSLCRLRIPTPSVSTR